MDEQIIKEILEVLKKCKDKLHKTKILCNVQRMVSMKSLSSQTKGARLSY